MKDKLLHHARLSLCYLVKEKDSIWKLKTQMVKLRIRQLDVKSIVLETAKIEQRRQHCLDINLQGQAFVGARRPWILPVCTFN